MSPYCHPAPCASNPAGVESSAVDPPLPFDPARSSHCVCDSHRALGVRGRQPRCDQEGDGGAGGTARVHHGGDGTGVEDWPTDQPASLVSRLTASCPLPCSRPACSTHIFSFLLLLRCRSFLTVFGRLVDDVCTASTFRRTLRHGRSRTSTCSVPPCWLLLSQTWARGAGRSTSPSAGQSAGQSWEHYFTKKTYPGGANVTVAAPLDEFPLFSLIPGTSLTPAALV